MSGIPRAPVMENEEEEYFQLFFLFQTIPQSGLQNLCLSDPFYDVRLGLYAECENRRPAFYEFGPLPSSNQLYRFRERAYARDANGGNVVLTLNVPYRKYPFLIRMLTEARFSVSFLGKTHTDLPGLYYTTKYQTTCIIEPIVFDIQTYDTMVEFCTHLCINLCLFRPFYIAHPQYMSANDLYATLKEQSPYLHRPGCWHPLDRRRSPNPIETSNALLFQEALFPRLLAEEAYHPRYSLARQQARYCTLNSYVYGSLQRYPDAKVPALGSDEESLLARGTDE